MADGNPRYVVGRPTKDDTTGLIALIAEWMEPVKERQLENLQEERKPCWAGLGAKQTTSSSKRLAVNLVNETRAKVKCASWDMSSKTNP